MYLSLYQFDGEKKVDDGLWLAISSVAENSEPSYILDIYYVRSCIQAYMYTHL